jgi:hypothetical protein
VELIVAERGCGNRRPVDVNPERKVWQLRYDRVALGLNSRIVDDLASNDGCQRSNGENLYADARASS